MRKTFIDSLMNIADIDKDVVLITSDMGFSVLEPFFEAFPDRALNCGIAEQNAVSLASGLALMGKKPYVYTISPFLSGRAFEQVKLDVAYMETNVKLVGIGAGFTYGFAGATHHAIEDIALMRCIPNMIVCAPGDNNEAKHIITKSINTPSPMYIRIGKHNRGVFNHGEVTIGKASIIEKGKDIAVISTSNMLPDAYYYCRKLEKEGRCPYFISMHTIKPLDKECLEKLIGDGVEIHTLEEHSIIGGLGSAVAEVVAESKKHIKFKRLGIPDVFTHHIGSQKYIKKQYGLYFEND
ncbi:transketolase C-terminal domain-containing protein [Helicobacter sp. 11S02629-2]|uniref:transketolase family protein n=1 Tax=Helicobacter sp. 11S02629-2 TaxID=1476195 RepID=UPI000BA68CA7|nr:transketolase C-terminal domain-containing protein [Helicobacter sp. 11S02629-2]PAF44655.1 1-deoxy-D-xylulose-5-phosphate synthase [Helicobacter sp. 11S02629-2]